MAREAVQVIIAPSGDRNVPIRWLDRLYASDHRPQRGSQRDVDDAEDQAVLRVIIAPSGDRNVYLDAGRRDAALS